MQVLLENDAANSWRRRHSQLQHLAKVNDVQ